MKRIPVLLADDHTAFREALRKLLEVEEDIQVVGEAKDGRQAVELTHKLRPAVVVMDLTMPVLTSLEATRIILSTIPRTKVLILSDHDDDGYVKKATELGVAGCLLKKSSARLLPKAVRQVEKGLRFPSPANAKAPPRQGVGA
jgi:DNA-binding NarL/FixJ family response regulator